MNAQLLFGSLLLVLCPASQDALTAPADAQSTRTPAIDTTVEVYDVKDLIQKLAPPSDPRGTGLEEKLDRFLHNQEMARRSWWSTDAKPDPEVRVSRMQDDERMRIEQNMQAELGLAATKDLAELVQRYMAPRFEADRQQLTVPSDGLIIGSLRPEQHSWLKRFFGLQKTVSGMIEISVTIFEGPRGAFRDAGLMEASTVFDDPAAFARLRARLDRAPNIAALNSPRLSALNGQKVSISTLSQVAYVKDWKLTLVEPGPQEIAVPTIDIVQDGLVSNFRATRLPGEVYGLDVAFTVSRLERPMAKRTIRISATSDREVEIGVPVVAKINFESKLLLVDGASVAFTTASPEPEKDIAIVMTLNHRSL